MLSRANSVSWMGGEDRDDENSWSRNICDIENNNNINNNNLVVDNVNGVSSSSFKTMLEVENEWYNITNNSTTENLLLNPPIIDSSSSCSPSPSVLNQSTTLDTSHIPYLFPPSKPHFFNKPLPPSLNNFGNADFFQELHQIPGNAGFSHFGTEMGSPNVGGNSHFTNTHLIHLGDNPGFGLGSASGSASKFRDFQEGSPNSSIFLNRTSKLLKPLDNSTPVGAQPTLFQKRAALRKNFGGTSSGNLTIPGSDSGLISNGGDGESERKRKMGSFGILDDVSFTGSDFNYDSDDFTENNNETCTLKDSDKNGGTNSNANSSMTGNGNGGGDSKGKKKGLPAKNLMAERRRRKKLNDRLYMLRSVVPKISKMDRASILGDAIEYLKELLQKINDLHNELESSPPASTLTQSTNFHPLTPTLPNLSSRIKEELCPSSMPSPNGQPARIEVRLREGRAVNIHMFCSRRPGLLLSTMRALDGLGLDIQQAVISCFNGFAMDIFRAEQCKDGQEVHPEQIKALLLDLATFHGSNIVANRNV